MQPLRSLFQFKRLAPAGKTMLLSGKRLGSSRLLTKTLSLLALVACFTFSASALTDTVLILHTNDLHDHIRPTNGNGGLAWLAGHVQELRRDRNDTLLLDAGDVMEKGDMAAYRSKSMIMYQAMARIGYDAVAPGNHDFAYGLPHLLACNDAGDFAMLCVNLVGEKTDAPPFPASKIFDVDGVKVGVIGLTISGKRPDVLSFEKTQLALAEEAARLEPQTHLIIVTAHLGPGSCAELMAKSSEIDVFIAGHQHGVLKKPRVVEATGGLIVEAGSYGTHLGQLELSIDLETEAIKVTKHQVTPLDHDKIRPDSAMADWLQQEEKRLAPEAAEVVGKADRTVGHLDEAQYLAEAIRFKAQADVGLCLAQKIIRNSIPAGEVDVNDLFKAGAPWAQSLVTVEMTGQEIVTYLLSRKVRAEQTCWSGFNAQMKYSRSKDCELKQHTLDPERNYLVAVCEIEWETKIKDKLEDKADRKISPCGYTLVQAATDYTRHIDGQGKSLNEAARELGKAAKSSRE